MSISPHTLPTLEALLGLLLCLTSIVVLTASSALLLRALRKTGVDLDQEASWLRYALLLTPALGPWLWFASSAAHAMTARTAIELCASAGAFCQDALVLSSGLLALVVSVIGNRLWRDVKHRASVVRLPKAHDAYRKLDALTERDPTLLAWREHITLTDGDCGRLCTLGVLRPRIECCVHLLDELSQEELHAALLHEIEHARAKDPLLFLLLLTARALNPVASLLEAESARWHATRELASDRRAHRHGADPLALASAIIKVSKHQRSRTYGQGLAAHLEGDDHNPTLIEARVHALLAMASEEESERRARASSLNLALSPSVCVLSLVTLQPHLSSSLLCVELHHLLNLLPFG